MIPKINIKYLENDIYSIISSKSITSSISYFDFIYTQPTLNVSSPSAYGTVSNNLYLKNIQLKRLEIPINTYLCNINNTEQIFNTIKHEINKDAYKIITSLGEKSRITMPINLSDFNIKKLKDKYNDRLSRSIMAKFISISNYIASNGRLGPAQYTISNFKTYNYILNNLDPIDLTYDKKGNLFIDNHSPYLIDDLIDDDIIIFGRKNQNNQSGVHCAILTDENNDIIFQEVKSCGDINSNLIMFYEVFDIGKNPEYQYIKINTRTLEYYRNKKLQRIKEIYGS